MSNPSYKHFETQIPNLPQEIKFCRKCVVSNQRPRIVFDDEGVCSACRYAEQKDNVIDWKARELELEQLLDRHRSKDGQYDVVVPGSGGKDSAFVAHELKHKWGMNPLTVTWSPFVYMDIGYKNWRSFIYSGFDNILATPNGGLHRKLAKLGFQISGDHFLPFIYGQNSYAYWAAKQYAVKLVFFGENAEAEYGGTTKNNDRPGLPYEDWNELLFKGAGIDNLVKIAVEMELITEQDAIRNFTLYRPPNVEGLKKEGISHRWYSYYTKWIPQENYYYCREHTGFEANPDGRSEGTYSKYASLDDLTDGFHYYMSYIKFGIGRATSDAGHEVRDGHITREEAVALVKRYDGEFPKKRFKEFLEYIDIGEDEFWTIVDGWRSPHIWIKENNEWNLRNAVYHDQGEP